MPLPRSLPACLCVGAALSMHAHAAHRHGELTMELAQEGTKLSIELHAPGEALLGFERAPRTQEEKAAMAAALNDLKHPDAWLAMAARAQCALTSASVQTTGFDEKDRKQAHGHAEIRASYRYDCKASAPLRTIDIGLFKRYARVKHIRVDMVLPGNQGSQSLSAGSTRLVLHP